MAEHDINKLPKWAQSRIKVAEDSAVYWRDKMTKAASGDTNVVIRRFPNHIGLPPDSQISFLVPLGDDPRRDMGRFDVRLSEPNRLEVSGVGLLTVSDQVRVIPRSSNLFYVELTPLIQDYDNTERTET